MKRQEVAARLSKRLGWGGTRRRIDPERIEFLIDGEWVLFPPADAPLCDSLAFVCRVLEAMPELNTLRAVPRSAYFYVTSINQLSPEIGELLDAGTGTDIALAAALAVIGGDDA